MNVKMAGPSTFTLKGQTMCIALRYRHILLFMAIILVLLLSVQQTAGADDSLELADMSLEDLMEMEITSVSKKEERLFESAAAVTVLTNEDIRRSGATSIPEALRLVPGLHVAQINANSWAISARGFNNEFANKLLVMIDGRSVYSPLFAGVFWDAQHVMLEDVERIEVIRGPGGSLWGANAVNGIINIITKSAQDTQGGILSGGGGTEHQGFGGFRYGGQTNNNTYFRLYSRYFNMDDGVDAAGDDGADEWDMIQGGFRLDWHGDEQDTFTLQGDIYEGQADEEITATLLTPPFTTTLSENLNLSGGNLLGRWTSQLDDDSDMTWQVYYDRTKRENYLVMMDEIRDTFDIDFQHRSKLNNEHELVWGLGYRFSTDDTSGTSQAFFNPADRDLHLFSGFLSDEITLEEDTLKLWLGSKFEHNDFTGFEFQPSARLLWTPDDKQSIWTSVTRAVRTPSRTGRDIQLVAAVIPVPMGMPIQSIITGDDKYESEKLIAYELGYRVQPRENLMFDISTFFNDYENLQTFGMGPSSFNPTPVPHIDQTLLFDNEMEGHTYGVEVTSNWSVASDWQLSAGYTFLKVDMDLKNANDPALTSEDDNPQNLVQLQSRMNLSDDWEFDTLLYYVENVQSQGVKIPSYLRLDVRLGWQISKDCTLDLVGQNLLDPQHPEYISLPRVATETERAFLGRLTYKF